MSDETSMFLDKLNERFVITNNRNDSVECKKLVDYFLKECNMNISTNKLGRLISSFIKLDDSIKKINNNKHRIGIKEII